MQGVIKKQNKYIVYIEITLAMEKAICYNKRKKVKVIIMAMLKEEMMELNKEYFVKEIHSNPTMKNLLIAEEWLLEEHFEGSMEFVIKNDFTHLVPSFFNRIFFTNSPIDKDRQDSFMVYLKLKYY